MGGAVGAFLDAATDTWSAFAGGSSSSLNFNFLDEAENNLYSAFETITGFGSTAAAPAPAPTAMYAGQENGTGRATGVAARHTQMMAQREQDVPRHAYQMR